MSDLIYVTDRSAAATDDKCGMKFWWNRKEGGIGIVPAAEPAALLVGRETHEDLATVGEMTDLRPEAIQEGIDDILAHLTDEDKVIQPKMEVLYRRLGWLAAFALYMEPGIREEYETIGIEREIILDRSPLWVAVTPDRVLRHRKNNIKVYKEYKTTITASQKWMQSWPFMIQLHIGLKAAEEELGESINYAQIMGLMKGYMSASDNRLMHPYVWGYYHETSDKWSHSYEDGKKTGWRPMPIWEYPGGITDWVRRCGPEVAAGQFPHSSPVFLNQKMLDGWVARRLHRERGIREVEGACAENPSLRNLHFEQRTEQCRPAFGDACPYLLACWNATVNMDPLKHPDYVKRVPHHDVEATFEGG